MSEEVDIGKLPKQDNVGDDDYVLLWTEEGSLVLVNGKAFQSQYEAPKVGPLPINLNGIYSESGQPAKVLNSNNQGLQIDTYSGASGKARLIGIGALYLGANDTNPLLDRATANTLYQNKLQTSLAVGQLKNGMPMKLIGATWSVAGAGEEWLGVVQISGTTVYIVSSGKVTIDKSIFPSSTATVGTSYWWSGTGWATTKPTAWDAFTGKIVPVNATEAIILPFKRRSSLFQPVTTLPGQVGQLLGNSDVMLAAVGNSLYQSKAGSPFTLVKQFPGTGIQTLTAPGDNFIYVGLRGISNGFGAWVWRAAYPFTNWSQYGANWGSSAFTAVGAIWFSGTIYAAPTGSSNRATFRFSTATATPAASGSMSKLGTVNGSAGGYIYGTQGNVAYLLQGNGNSAADVSGFPATVQSVLSLFVSGSNLYVGTAPAGNVYARENNTWSTIATPASNVYGVAVNTNNLYIATEKGVYLTSLTGDRKSWGLIYNKDTRSIGVTAAGKLYIGTSGGEILYRP